MSVEMTKAKQQPVHYPAKPDLFEFDNEVASIFDDMAKRAIPMYDAVQDMHAAILITEYHKAYADGKYYNLMDVGSSTGRFFKEICNQLHLPFADQIGPAGFAGVGLDPSPSMDEQLRNNVPWVERLNIDLMSVGESYHGRFDAVNMAYVLQFIPVDQKAAALHVAFRLLKPGGLLLMAQKDDVSHSEHSAIIYQQYDNFKINHGYTREEIDAKTQALKGSMWPVPHERLTTALHKAGFRGITETTRWGCFSSLIARRP